jgi:5-methyltetrahydropteroyltriglutamate--homocysteine methyltransferase
MVLTTVVGHYPRVGDTHEEQSLRRAIAGRDNGDISEDDLREAERDVVRTVLKEQNDAGISLVTDGQVTWYDAVSHFSRGLSGVEITGLVRYFDTNIYYRQPCIVGSVAWQRPILVDEWKYANDHSKAPVKAVLTGPVTLAHLAADSHYGKRRTLAIDLSKALALETKALVKAGVRHLQVDEPILAREPGELPLVADTLRAIAAEKGPAKLTLAVYFGDVAPIYRELFALPADGLLLDLVQGAKTWPLIAKHGAEKPVALGLVDARNTKLEDPRAIAAQIRKLRDVLDLGRTYVSPSNGLEFLPRARAREKLAVLSEAAKLVGVGA